MSKHINIVMIDGTKHSNCELCGAVEELRPYGPKGEAVCFTCMKKDEESAKHQFAKLIQGKDLIIIK